jgi:MFS family permease
MPLLLLLCAAQLIGVLDGTIVAVALPAIQHDLGFSPAGLQWVVTAYALAFGGLLIPAGRAGDVFGHRRLFMFGLALFSAASAGCGLSAAPMVLVGMRALQGAGAALFVPAALSLVTAAFPGGPRRHRALALWTAAGAVGGASGWVLSGILTQTLGWPAIFFVNAPLGLAGALLSPRLLPSGGAAGAAGAGAGRLRRLDLPGALVVSAALVALVLGLTRVQSDGLAAPRALGAIVIGALLLGAFAAVERRVAAPLLPPGTFRNRRFARATLVAAVLTAATTPAMLLSVLYQQQVLHRSATATGLWCLPFNAGVIGGSLLAGRLRDAPARAVMAAGLAVVAAGALCLIVALAPGYLVMGGGLGAAAVASTASGTSALSGQRGLASGLLNSAAQVGPPLGLAVLVSVAASRSAAAGSLASGYRWGFAGAAAVALAGIVPVLMSRRDDDAAQGSSRNAATRRTVAASSRSVART